jgi:type IV secretory pathway ATPase VirB11/archaellum biosynthesis ATPase
VQRFPAHNQHVADQPPRIGEAQVTADAPLGASLRVQPDRIIVGELRGAQACRIASKFAIAIHQSNLTKSLKIS